MLYFRFILSAGFEVFDVLRKGIFFSIFRLLFFRYVYIWSGFFLLNKPVVRLLSRWQWTAGKFITLY